ncbi:MAG: peptidylprolyl isomerase [Ignavibacteriales bacterium]|nr:peptidylprolyl isomerase [Ignavibacteriales bacterium]
MKNCLKTVMLVVTMSAPPLTTLCGQTVIDRIVAVVDKEIITESELQERVSLIALQNRMDPNRPELRNQVLEGLITEKLILAQAILDSIVVSEAEVTQSLEQQLQNIVRQAGSEQRVEQYYGMPMSRIRREFREDMRKQLLVQRIRQTREANLLVSRREVEEFYSTYRDSLPQVPEQFQLSNIFIVPKPDSAIEAQIRQKLQSILDSIRTGGDFADFARRHSQDGTASSGGDLGWAKRGTFVPEFEAAAFALPEKGVSGIVKTEFGFHVVQLLERRGESVHARHILLRVEKGAASDSAATTLLRTLRSRALAGESFAEFAKKYSEDEETKALGGDLGTVTPDQLEPEFAAVVETLNEGDISEPTRITLKTSYGYQIVSVRKRIPAHAMNLEDDYRRVEQIALFFKRNRVNAEWVDELKRSIYWEVRL